MLGLIFIAVAATIAVGCSPDLKVDQSHAAAAAPVSGILRQAGRVTLTLIRSDILAGPFTGRLDYGGRCLTLPGPDDPTGLFDFFPNAVIVAPPGHVDEIIILYDQVHRAPDGERSAKVLVYRVADKTIARDPALERRLDGVRSAARARRILAGRR